MATTCRTASGDVLDTLCQNYYGHLNGTVEAVLDANQGLADEVQPYRAGVVIHLPDVVGASEEGVMLWGLPKRTSFSNSGWWSSSFSNLTSARGGLVFPFS